MIEDNRLLRDGIAAMLNGQGDFEVVARSEDGDAVRQLKTMRKPPDVVLLDLGLEKANSLKLMSLLQEELPTAKIIAMDILPEHIDIVEFVKAGGYGFILKNAPLEDWIKTIKAVATGAKVLPPVLTKSLFTQIVEFTLNPVNKQWGLVQNPVEYPYSNYSYYKNGPDCNGLKTFSLF